MSKVLLTLATQSLALAAGVTFSGNYLFKVASLPPQTVAATTATFDGVNDGDVATCESLDANGVSMGDQVSVTISIPAAGVPPAPSPAPAPAGTYPAPASLAFQILA